MAFARALFPLVAFAALTPVVSPEGCYLPGPGDAAGGGIEEPPASCPPSAPQEGCPCDDEAALGCTDDGLVHEEAFMCVEGAWEDVYDTTAADDAFCTHPSLVYNYCAFIDGAVWTNCTVGP